jgi:hypothetical protein
MSQRRYDKQEEVFSNEYTPKEEKHQALADKLMADIIASYKDDSTEVLMILSERLKKMALGEVDNINTDVLHGILDLIFDAPFDTRHDPLNRFVTDAIYSEALALAELDL